MRPMPSFEPAILRREYGRHFRSRSGFGERGSILHEDPHPPTPHSKAPRLQSDQNHSNTSTSKKIPRQNIPTKTLCLRYKSKLILDHIAVTHLPPCLPRIPAHQLKTNFHPFQVQRHISPVTIAALAKRSFTPAVQYIGKNMMMINSIWESLIRPLSLPTSTPTPT